MSGSRCSGRNYRKFLRWSQYTDVLAVHVHGQRRMQGMNSGASLHVYDRNCVSRLRDLIETSGGHLGRMRLLSTQHVHLHVE